MPFKYEIKAHGVLIVMDCIMYAVSHSDSSSTKVIFNSLIAGSDYIRFLHCLLAHNILAFKHVDVNT